MNISELEKLVSKYRNIKFEKVFDYSQMFESYEQYAENIQGRKVKLGMPGLDKLLGMIRPSQLVTIIGSTNVGKTTIAMHMCYHNSKALKDKLIIMFNLEIDENEILERTLCTEFDITSSEVENAFIKKDSDTLTKFKKIEDKFRNYISVIGRVDIHDIIPYTKAIEEYYDKDTGLIVVDYLGLVKNKNFKEEYSRVSDNIQKLKEIALHLQIPVIDISQTSRADVKNNKNGLNLYSAKSSGEVENSSQIVIVINKFTTIEKLEKAVPKIPESIIDLIKNEKIYLLEAKIEKKKQGSFGKCYLVQERRNLRIFDMDEYIQKYDNPLKFTN